jgi:transposase-like protein
VIVLAVRRYLRCGLSYRDVEELLVERGVEVNHVTVYPWVQRFTPLLADAARFCRHSPGDRWFVDETYVKVNGVWRYVYRAIDQYGQVIDVLVSARRDADAARRFFRRVLATLKVTPSEVVTDAVACGVPLLNQARDLGIVLDLPGGRVLSLNAFNLWEAIPERVQVDQVGRSKPVMKPQVTGSAE